MAKLCPKCGNIYGDEDRFCHIDGTKLEDHPVSPPLRGASAPASKTDQSSYLGKTLLDQFEILEVCGSGSMGTVYKAKQKPIDRIVAIKILHPQLAQQPEAVLRFHREAKIISTLNHPNIVHIYLFGHLPDGNLYIVQEFVDGRSLATELKKTIEPLRAIHIACQVLSAIAEAHAVGVIHRDLKPENIMLKQIGDDNDFVKILDFGVAKKIVTKTFATKEGLIFGSPKYISPEAALGDKIDGRSDLYSLGVILYQMLCGATPFNEQTPLDLLMAHINKQPPPLKSHSVCSNLPDELERIVMKLLSKNPTDRFPTASGVKEALEYVNGMMGGTKLIRPLEPESENKGKKVKTVISDHQFASGSEGERPYNGNEWDEEMEEADEPETDEQVYSTEQLYSREMRREKIKNSLKISGIIAAGLIIIVSLAYGFGFLEKKFSPYEEIKNISGEEKIAPSHKKSTTEKTENENILNSEQNLSEEIFADIQIEKVAEPTKGDEVTLICTLSKSVNINHPHFIIRNPDRGIEIKLKTDRVAERKYTVSYTFPHEGSYNVTFASKDRVFSPSVRIYVKPKKKGKTHRRKKHRVSIREIPATLLDSFGPKAALGRHPLDQLASDQPPLDGLASDQPPLDRHGIMEHEEDSKPKIKVIPLENEEKSNSWY